MTLSGGYRGHFEGMIGRAPNPSAPDGAAMPPGRLGLSGLFFILLFATGSPVRAHGLPFHAGSTLTAGFQENAARTFVGLMGRSGRVGTPLGSVRRQVDVFMVGGGGLGFETSGIGDPIVDTKWTFHRRDRPGGHPTDSRPATSSATTWPWGSASCRGCTSASGIGRWWRTWS